MSQPTRPTYVPPVAQAPGLAPGIAPGLGAPPPSNGPALLPAPAPGLVPAQPQAPMGGFAPSLAPPVEHAAPVAPTVGETSFGGRVPDVPVEGIAGRPEIERLLTGLVESDGSDLILSSGLEPHFSLAGSLLPVVEEEILGADEVLSLVTATMNKFEIDRFTRVGDVNFAYAMKREEGAALDARFRVNVAKTSTGTSAFCRWVPDDLPNFEALGIPPQVRGLSRYKSGLVIFAGSTGSGKSTAQASIIDDINATRDVHIVTLEDPIEFVHRKKKAVITQREVGPHTETYLSGLENALRQKPDVIMLGEMRTFETMNAAMAAADAGHLVLTTLHANSAPEVISRIVNSFPAERQGQIRSTLASVLKAVVFQTLVPTALSHRGRVLAAEVMISNPAIASLIERGEVAGMRSELSNRTTGSMSLDFHLSHLVKTHKLELDQAQEFARDKELLHRYLAA